MATRPTPSAPGGDKPRPKYGITPVPGVSGDIAIATDIIIPADRPTSDSANNAVDRATSAYKDAMAAVIKKGLMP